jgi:SAM-dependent methyltransferase
LGYGTGWTSAFFARAGYSVTGVDISRAMLTEARRKWSDIANLTFIESDYEAQNLTNCFDCAVFFHALHRAVDEKLALAKAYQALKPGGVCVTDEPGVGHAQTDDSQTAVSQYGVTEKDMPPKKIAALARETGFGRIKIYPGSHGLAASLYGRQRGPLSNRLWRLTPDWLAELAALWRAAQKKRNYGVCALYK